MRCRNRVLLAAGLTLGIGGCQAKGTCIVVEEQDAAEADTCWVSYPQGECTALGERSGSSVTFHVESPAAGVSRCRREGFVDDVAGAPPADGSPISMTRPKAPVEAADG